LQSLEDALAAGPRNDLERDGIIQRFEYSFELAWKVGKIFLADQGIAATTPKLVIRELAKRGFLDEPELWLECLEARNKTSHIYKKEVADEVFAKAKAFAPSARRWIDALTKVA
jgi:nucleotidyltransferase substrate binding protein (TIGR01987 family)